MDVCQPKSLDPRGRVLIIGLDGATFGILDPLVRKGIMPNLAKLIQEGVSGPLASVVPTNSAAAWASFMTGQLPHKHGIFEFRMRNPRDFGQFVVANSNYISGKALWDVLSSQNKISIVINVPMTYPPQRINGVIVSGLGTPSTNHSFTYPPDIQTELKRAVGEYVLTVPWIGYENRAEDLLSDLSQVTRIRTRAALHLMKHYPFDVFMLVYDSPDRLQHCLWRFMDPSHPRYDPEEATLYRSSIENHYRLLDDCLGQLFSYRSSDDYVLVISDHGFQAADRQIVLNEWLAQQGWLRTSNQSGPDLLEPLRRLHSPWILGLRMWWRRHAPERLRQIASGRPQIDWSHTVAYSSLEHQQGISINLRGREPWGIVPSESYEDLRMEIAAALRAWCDPNTDQSVVQEVLPRETLGEGPFADTAPDLYVIPHSNYYVAPTSGWNRLFRSTGWATGGHSLEGILIGSGPDIRRGPYITAARLIDLAPTILYALDLPVPRSMDGRILEEIFEPERLDLRRPTHSIHEFTAPGMVTPASNLTEDEEEAIEQRLRGLGYLS